MFGSKIQMFMPHVTKITLFNSILDFWRENSNIQIIPKMTKVTPINSTVDFWRENSYSNHKTRFTRKNPKNETFLTHFQTLWSVWKKSHLFLFLHTGDRTVAHGYNYHQGPEWVWPVGYFLRAYLHFGQAVGKRSEAVGFCMSVLSGHYTHVQNSHWRGIPELTNKKGEKCPHSNPIQAWSMACLLEVLRDIQQIWLSLSM